MEDKFKKREMARKLLLKRRNVEYVLQYSNVTPFMWYKGRYRCFYCAEPMKDPVLLREHTAKVHQFANLELVVHDRTKNNRNRDAAVKIDVTDIACKLCPNTVNSLEELIHHLIIAHDAEYDVSVPNCLLPFKLDREHPSCPTCNLQFIFFEYLLRHANKHHLSHDYICDVCGTSFQGENHLKMHNRYYHREGGYTCEHCGISLATLSKKTLHEKNVHMINLYTCPHCPETFKSPYFKKLHLANVHGVEELKIKCPYCPKVYPQESIMSRHMRRVHLREKNVECEVCGDKFFGPYDVKLHMLKHNGDKKFVCTVCGKKFAKKSNLNSHFVIHTGAKKYACTVCGKEFAHRPNLRMHFNSRHPQHETSLGEAEIVQMELEGAAERCFEIRRRTTDGDSADSKTNEKSFKLEQESFDNETFLSEIENMTATRKKTKQEMSKQEKLEVIRRNIAQVLVNSTIHPFKWARSLYRCFFCCEEFKDPTNLLSHFGSHSTPEEIYLTMNNYWETIVYVDVSTISCKLCPTKIEKLQELIDHLIQNHQIDFNKNVPIGMVPFKLSEKSAKCLECDLVFRSYAHLFVHTVRSHQHYSVIHCNICGQHFKSSQDMYVHKSRTHSKKEAKCTVCGLIMPVTKIKTHLQNFHGKKYDCFHCPEKFVTHYQRARHFIEVHNSREKKKCTYCPRTFVFGSSLKRHVREIHLREKDSVCDVCGWEGFGRARMERHMMKHSDERNIKCPECDKAYKTRKTMRQHFRNTHRRQESAALFVDA